MNRLLVVLTALLVFAGCSRAPQKTPLVIYSPHGKEMLAEYERQFEAAHPDVDVQWLDMGSQDVYDRVRTERENPQADVWWGGPMTSFEKAGQEGLLEPYVPSWDNAVPADAKSKEAYWYGTFLTPEVIMFNNRMLTEYEAPKDWDELLDPRWKGKIIIRYPLASGTMRTIFCALIQRENERTGDSTAGFRWLKRLDANTKTYVADPNQLYIRVAREEAPVTVWDMPDVEVQINKSLHPFSYNMPASGTPVLIEGIAIVKGTRHLDLAKAFYEFVTSKQSMIQQANDFYRIPARSDLPSGSLPSWIKEHQWKPMHVNWRDLAAHEQQWMQYWDEHVKGSGTAEPSSSL